MKWFLLGKVASRCLWDWIFFKKVIKLQKHYAKPNQRIVNDLQTNGIMLDDAWCQFLKKENFLVGISIDGPRHLHDAMRKTNNNKPTFELVMRAVNRLHQYKIPFHALCVVSQYNAQYPLEVYEFLKNQVRPRMIQFLSAVEPINFKQSPPPYFRSTLNNTKNSKSHIPTRTLDTQVTSDAFVTKWSVSAQAWGNFLVMIWRYWLRYDVGRVFVDQFENTISQALGLGAQKCTTAPICGKALAIEHNGDVYSCDHFVYPAYKLGNIHESHEHQLAFSRQQQAFGYAKHLTLPSDCKQCSYLKLCWGECPKNRFITTQNGEHGLNYLCVGLKHFYAQVIQDLPRLQKHLQH
ncbi:anaerobic sulfatase maturase [Moraxella canis]|uniref:anaerobic sulfatase maturase n=1 Tax=Moraxella canis TaxID=90239 RepID=UPI0019552441|nr:anaerobic sulfatase maturase [Moraxella canis]